MRLIRITLQDFRSFRGRNTISFLEPLTGRARSTTVIAGTNGSGKTTIFEAVEALLSYVVDPDNPRPLIREAWETGFVSLELELTPVDLNWTGVTRDEDYLLTVAVGRRDKAPIGVNTIGKNLVCKLVQRGTSGKSLTRTCPLAARLRKAVLEMHQDRSVVLHGGLVYFPHGRKLEAGEGGPIEPPPEERQWNYRFSPARQWRGHIEQLWVWQNYLDLERGLRGGEYLKPFVQLVEETLGSDRRIVIREGKVYIKPAWAVGDKEHEDALVRLHELPSGEQQVLIIIGELTRRARYGAVIAIDEPEISLHPTLQRVLLSRLKGFASHWDAQLILATHSLEILRAVHSSELVNLDQLGHDKGATVE